MPAWLLLAAAAGQLTFGDLPREVLRDDPEPAVVCGAWRMLGPLPPLLGAEGPASRLALPRAGEPWLALDEPYAAPGGRPLLWRDADLDAIADAAATHFVLQRRRAGLATGRVEPARLPLLAAEDGPRTALFYRVAHARERLIVTLDLSGGGTTRAWINGAPVGRAEAMALEPGLNHLLIESTAPAEGDWWFELRQGHAPTQPAIHRAIDAGMHFLLSRQLADGAWQQVGDFRSGSTALALFALLKSGLPRDHAAARAALAALRREPPERTYATALAILAIAACGDPAHDRWLGELAGDLIEWQGGDGLWGYPYGAGDLSNTQFAALALHSAARRGIEIPRETWRDLERATRACRERDGAAGGRGRASGFGYSIAGSETPSMTAAGVGTLQICSEHLGEDFDRRSRAALDGGLAWLGEHCPLHAPLGGGWSYYLLYGLERAGALARTESFGEHPWYAEGAAHLLDSQLGNGAWSGDDVDTCFALLFLTRATAKAAVTMPEGGDGAGRLFVSDSADGPLILRAALGERLELWVDSASPDFERFARVVYWLRPPDGEWRQVPGGPTKRHDARVALERPGLWQARASAFLFDGNTLGSGTLEIAHQLSSGASPDRAEAGDEPAANLLRAGACEALASSAARGGEAAGACDQSAVSRWLCAADDAAPWLELRPARRVHGRSVVLRPVLWLPGDDERQPEPARVRVSVDEGASVVADLPPGWPARWRVDLGASREIRRLRIEILGVRRGALGDCRIGFAEVEIHQGDPDGE